MPATLWVSVAAAWTAAALFAVLGATLVGREVRRDSRLANLLFAIWWYAVALQNGINGLRIVLAQLEAPLTLLVGLQFVNIAAVTVGLAALLYYLIFLFTGRTLLLWPLLLFYAIICSYLIYLVSWWDPVGIEVGAWSVSFTYANAGDQRAVLTALLLLVGPQLLAVLGLIGLAMRLPASASRVRVAVIAGAILVWFGSGLLSSSSGVDGTAWNVFRQLIPIAVGWTVLAVHRPPPWLRHRLPPEIPHRAESEATSA